MKIAVLSGGLSPERNVSLSSGGLIARALKECGHRVVLLDVYTGIDDKRLESAFLIDEEISVADIGNEIPDLDAVKASNNGQIALIGKNVLALCGAADVVFIALHGDMGENGMLQATLDNFDIKYTGSGYIGSLLAMDKDLSKRIIKGEGVPTPSWIYRDRINYDREEVLIKPGLPCVVKPCSLGSSVGVSLVKTEAELDAAVSSAFRYEKSILIEKMICGREFSVGILDDTVLPPIEIIPREGFYDYGNKYQKGKTTEICPAELSEAETETISGLAVRAFKALRLSGYARFDFIYGNDGIFYCLEANTLPGMTPTSLLPQEAAAVGISYNELCNRIATLGCRPRK